MDDDMESIYTTLKNCAMISKWAGGIGIHVSNVRANGARINSTGGKSDGIVPMLKVFNETARYSNQSGKRKGSFAIYLEPWHSDIWEFVELRRNTGADTERTRDLFLSLWIPDEFMARVDNNDDWYLFSPDQCPDLVDAIGEEFSALYNRYVEAAVARHAAAEAAGNGNVPALRKMKARALLKHIMTCQLETGAPYVLFKDHVNRKCNQSNVGTIRSSNLCAEITQYSDSSEYAVCNLASISLPHFVDVATRTVDHAALHATAREVAYNLDSVIDINYYPVPEARVSNMKMRPMGIGIQGMGDVYCMLSLPYTSPEAIQLDADVMETIYHGAMTATVEMAERDGAYSRFEGSPASRGKLQFDLWGVTPSSGRYDWDTLRARVVRSGMRNSMLTALMPTASTSQILGNCESFEPYQGNIYKRTTLVGEYIVVNKHLLRDLQAIGLWSPEMRQRIIVADGSVQGIEEIPAHLREVYRTVWELPQKSVIDHAVARGPYVDQSQSMNLYMRSPDTTKLMAAFMYGWKMGLKTGMYYLRSAPAVEAKRYALSNPTSVQKKTRTDDPAAAAAAAAAGSGAAAASAAAAGSGACPMRKKGAPVDEECLMCSA
ncbi:hypothetical protein FOA52_001581 [Chlamydomonas sp. UWO 241]|nr:hypothetical protein FOA52_001581 [Chlamydomonas sp. UWO 241]